MQRRKWPFTLTQLKTARPTTLSVQAYGTKILRGRTTPPGSDLPRSSLHTNSCWAAQHQPWSLFKLAQERKTELKCCMCLAMYSPKGHMVWGAFRRQWGRWEMPSKLLNPCKTVFPPSQPGAFRGQSLPLNPEIPEWNCWHANRTM